MNKYTFSIYLFLLKRDEAGYYTPKALPPFTDTVEAERQSAACIRAWTQIDAECVHLKAKHGVEIGVGDLHMKVVAVE
jgi:hypothetical protein